MANCQKPLGVSGDEKMRLSVTARLGTDATEIAGSLSHSRYVQGRGQPGQSTVAATPRCALDRDPSPVGASAARQRHQQRPTTPPCWPTCWSLPVNPALAGNGGVKPKRRAAPGSREPATPVHSTATAPAGPQGLLQQGVLLNRGVINQSRGRHFRSHRALVQHPHDQLLQDPTHHSRLQPQRRKRCIRTGRR